VDIAAQAIAREREMPTDLGFGVAVPHARCRGLTEPIVVFGRSADGIVFDHKSASLVHLVFLLLTPEDQPNLQVLLLSQVARIAGDPDARRRLLAAESVAEVREILTLADPEPTPTGKPTRGGVS
jgi:mannitol/fructose-specific phosphotransferase system IIA component (Ntr-type)